MNVHEASVEAHGTHRAGVTYYRPRCSCGWYTRGVTRSRDIAEQQAAAHIRRAAR